MAVEITQITDDEITVNQKSVYKDSNGKWIASQELSINEILFTYFIFYFH